MVTDAIVFGVKTTLSALDEPPQELGTEIQVGQHG
jgi:hypothetical protein